MSQYGCYATGLSSSLVITVKSSLTYNSFIYSIWAGTTGSSVDVTTSNVGSASSYTGAAINLTPTANNEVVVVAVNNYASGTAPTSSGGGGYTLIANSAFTGTTYACGAWYQIQTTATTTTGGTITNAGGGNFASTVCANK